MKNLLKGLKKLGCRHEDEGGQMIAVRRGADYGVDREVYGVFICSKCGGLYTRVVNRNDPAVKAMLPPM